MICYSGSDDPHLIVKLDPALRTAIFKAWGEQCAYCMSAPAKQVDHIIPRAVGGADRLDNLVASCLRCNAKKKDRLLAAGYLQILHAQARDKAAKVLSIKAQQESRKHIIKVHPRPARYSPLPGHFLFELGMERRQCELLSDMAWSFNPAGVGQAVASGCDADELWSGTRIVPIMTWRDARDGTSGSWNNFIQHFSRSADGSEVTIAISRHMLPLIHTALTFNASVFCVEGWVFSGADKSGELTIDARQMFVYQSFKDT